MTFIEPPPANSLLRWGAVELARQIAQREVSAVEVLREYRARNELINLHTNAVVNYLWDNAEKEAIKADSVSERGEYKGALHGVPFTVKDCFHVTGTASTLGLPQRANKHDATTSPLVMRWQIAGGILLGKTNVPQLMMLHETVNPLYGETKHPLDSSRSPGGSSGGEAAAIASFCSPLGLANDLGGSIRLPAHWCGLCGIKPTTYRLTNAGITGNFHGMHVLRSQVGPMARRVEDLQLGLQLLWSDKESDTVPHAMPVTCDLLQQKIKIAAWETDGYFPACPTARRAVHEAAEKLQQHGIEVDWISPNLEPYIDLYYGIMGADGGASARSIAGDNPLDKRIARMLWMSAISGWQRSSIVHMVAWQGQSWLARILRAAGPKTASVFWQLTHRLHEWKRQFLSDIFTTQGYAAILSPPHALPALHCNTALDFLPAASYAYLANLLGLPAGVIPWTQVQQHETEALPLADTHLQHLARRNLQTAVGLPVGIQIMGGMWREDIVLALLKILEKNRHLA
jgi:fatty acid amide hydrolase